MKPAWKQWENSVGKIFENVGYKRVDVTSGPASLPVGCYCLEPLNREMQVDVSVRVSQNEWIAVECRNRYNKTLKPWLHQVRGRVATRTRHLQTARASSHPKVYGVAATSLHNIDPKLEGAAADAGIALWHHGVVDYLRAITKGSRERVRDLVLYRAGIRRSSYPPILARAQRWPGLTRNWFVGFIAPEDIARATFVYQRGRGFGERAYQRLLRPTRIEDIAEFVADGNVFPNSIVLALPPSTKLPRVRPGEVCTLTIPGAPEGIKVIDGQHRFFGALASGHNPSLLCTLLVADDLEQALLFATLNGKQIKVTGSDLISLFAIPAFVAGIARGVREQDRQKIERQSMVFRAVTELNRRGPLRKRLNLTPGSREEGQIPFKTIYDAVLRIASSESSGIEIIAKSSTHGAERLGRTLADYLSAWETIIGKRDFVDTNVWFQPTVISALIVAFPSIRHAALPEHPVTFLRGRRSHWKRRGIRPEAYRGAGGASRLADVLCRRLKVVPLRKARK